MSLSLSRRCAAAGAAVALSVTGLAVIAPATAVAQASEECKTTESFTDGTWTYKKTILGSNEVAPGGTVRAEIHLTAGATAYGAMKITDIHPPELEVQSATVEAWHAAVPPGHQTHDHMVTADSSTRASVSNTLWPGWAMANGYTKAVFTYKLSEDAVPGTLLKDPSGIGVVYSGPLVGDTNRDYLGVCVKVREKNPVEAVTGSLDGMGLGSATGSADGSAAGSEASSDPAGFIASILNQINLGKIIGLS